MFRPTLFIKPISIVFFLGILHFIVVFIFILPKVEESVYNIEKKNAIAIMDKISSVSHNIYQDINYFKKTALDIHKENLKDRKKELSNALYKIIAQTKIAQTGYIYVFNSKGDLLYHPDNALKNINLNNIENQHFTLLYKDLLKAYNNSKELHYLWDKADDKENYIYEKASWIEYVPELDWYIVSSVYQSELQKSSIEIKDFLVHTALFVFVIFIFIISIIFGRLDKYLKEKASEIKILKERMETALNANKDAVWEFNVQNWNDGYLSTRWFEILGYDKNEVHLNAFEHWKERVHPEDFDEVMEEARKNHEKETDFYESIHRVRHKDGHWIWMHSRGNTTFDKDGKATRFIGTFTDVTEKKELEDELKVYKKIVDSTKSHMSYIDTNYVYKVVNPMYLIAHNKTTKEIVGHTVLELFGEDIFKNLLKENLDICFSGKEVHYSAWFEMKVGKVYMDVSYIPHKNSKGKVLGAVISSNNITKLQTTEEALKKLANIDPLTKLYNRRYLFDMAKNIISLAKREQTKVSMLMIDIDKFKKINDTYGHAIGDEVIKDLASFLLKQTRASDIVARIGGEEFVVLLPNTSKDSADKFADTLRAFVEKKEVSINENKSISFTISIGVSELDIENEIQIEEALARADKALYMAKKSGRNRVC